MMAMTTMTIILKDVVLQDNNHSVSSEKFPS
jgi:hypothetical protein